MTPKNQLITDIFNHPSWNGNARPIVKIVDAHWPKDPVQADTADRKMDAEPEYADWVIWNATADSVSPVPQGTHGEVHLSEDSTASFDEDIAGFDWSISSPFPIIRYRLKKPAPVRSVARRYGSEYPDGVVTHSREPLPYSTLWVDHPLIDGKPDFSRQPTWGKL